jgi:predicted kinase
VIYDATNAKLEWRLQFLQHFRSTEDLAEIQWMAWWVNTPLAICQQRNQKRDRIVPPIVIDAMAAHLQDFPPHPGEGFVAVHTLPMCADGSLDMAAVFRQIDRD